MALAEQFAQCGLNSSESKVLEYLVPRGALSAGRIARDLRIKRPTVYAALERLVAEGLVLKERQRGATHFRAASRRMVLSLLRRAAKRKFEQADSAVADLEGILAEIPEREELNIGGFAVSTMETEVAVYAHLEEVLQRGNFCSFFNPQEMPQHHWERTVTKFLGKTAETKPPIREFAVAGPAASWYCSMIRNKNHKVKLLPANCGITSDIIIGGDSVVVNSYVEERELAIKISEPNLCRSLTAIFELLWAKL